MQDFFELELVRYFPRLKIAQGKFCMLVYQRHFKAVKALEALAEEYFSSEHWKLFQEHFEKHRHRSAYELAALGIAKNGCNYEAIMLYSRTDRKAGILFSRLPASRIAFISTFDHENVHRYQLDLDKLRLKQHEFELEVCLSLLDFYSFAYKETKNKFYTKLYSRIASRYA